MQLIDRQLPPVRASAHGRGGFTLTELLVVVGIIIALIALLIPALSHVRKQGRNKEAEALLRGISGSLDAYHTTFGAYPGPVAPQFTSSSGSKMMSGAQNMLMGLSYAVWPSSFAPAGSLPIDPGGNFAVDASTASGPNNLAVVGPTGAPEHLNPFYTFPPSKVSPAVTLKPATYNTGGFKGIAPSANNNFKFPVLLDNFPDPLPILYYRRNQGVVNPVAFDTMEKGDAAYYLQENLEYTTGRLEVGGNPAVPNTGTVYDQSQQKDARGNITSYVPLRSNDLELLANDGGTPDRAKGGYILIIAGEDRLYGGIPSTDPTKAPLRLLTNDNIVVVGGN